MPQIPVKTRVILELGSGNDLHGSDYTKAALRAVQDALHHSSLAFIPSLKIDKSKLDVEVTIGVQRPERVDLERVKAALRAVQDALHHSSLAFVRSLKIDRSKLDVEVTIGVQRPERVDLERVKASLPVGNVSVKAVKGGLDIADPENNDPAVIASAAIAVRIERG